MPELETELERQICSDPEWLEGARWGKPRPGHQEGKVVIHIAQVLENIDREPRSQGDRAKLRLIALVHDTFKYKVNHARPRSGANHHAAIARRFAEGYISDPEVLEIIELHDEAYNSWGLGARKGRWDRANARAGRLIARLGPLLPLYLAFYRADNATPSKSSEPLAWFEELAGRS